MTLSQLEHLKLIDAHLERLLDIASKRTPGKWGVEQTDTTNWIGPMRQNGNGKISIVVCDTDRDVLRSECIGQNDDDAAFIAACAGNAEAGWRATRAVVQNWISLGEYLGVSNPKNNPVHLPPKQSKLLESILAAFPLENLNPKQP